MKKVYTTGDVAKICQVTINTAVKWFDSGKMKGYRIPSSGARRVSRSNLLAFLKKHDFPLDELVSDRPRVLVVDNNKANLARFHKVLSERARYLVQTAATGFEAGLQAVEFTPDVIFLNVDLKGIDGGKACGILRGNESTSNAAVVAMSSRLKPRSAAALKRAGFVEAVSKPVSQRRIREIIARLVPDQT
jgi:CheY-like chemotaxis protein